MEWQPISTVRTDGVWVLIHEAQAGDVSPQVTPAKFTAKEETYTWHDGADRWHPTHWAEIELPSDCALDDEPAPAEALLGGINRDASSFWRA